MSTNITSIFRSISLTLCALTLLALVGVADAAGLPEGIPSFAGAESQSEFTLGNKLTSVFVVPDSLQNIQTIVDQQTKDKWTALGPWSANARTFASKDHQKVSKFRITMSEESDKSTKVIYSVTLK